MWCVRQCSFHPPEQQKPPPCQECGPGNGQAEAPEFADLWLAVCLFVAESMTYRQVTSLCSAPVAQDVYMRALQGAQASAITGLVPVCVLATCLLPLPESVQVCRAEGACRTSSVSR